MNFRHLPTIIFFSMVFSFNIMGQQTENTFTFLSYNVENLFDTINNPNKSDDEFTPNGTKKWDTKKYQTKLGHIAEVINKLGIKEKPELVALYEIENESVLVDLLPKLESKYAIIHRESPDKRGIDVALLYRIDEFEPLLVRQYPVAFNFEPNTTTRDILYVKGIASKQDTFHIFLNHWSSRRGGMYSSEKKRISAAKILRLAIDSVLNINEMAKVIAVGDFNDEPTNYSMSYYLQANNKRLNAKYFELYNLMYDLNNIEKKGTYSFKGKWDMIDNILVSQSLLLKDKGYYTEYNSGHIFNPKWLLYYNAKADEYTPNKTYGGKSYFGGYSDHLPVYFTLIKGQ